MFSKKISLFIVIIVIVLAVISFQKAIVQKEVMLSNQQLFNQVQHEIKQRQYEEAQNHLETLLGQFQQAPIYYLSAEIEMRLGNFNEAAQKMYRVLQLDPHYVDNPKFLLYYLEILISNKDLKRAEQVLQRCLDFHPSKTTAAYKERVYALALLVEQRGNVDG